MMFADFNTFSRVPGPTESELHHSRRADRQEPKETFPELDQVEDHATKPHAEQNHSSEEQSSTVKDNEQTKDTEQPDEVSEKETTEKSAKVKEPLPHQHAFDEYHLKQTLEKSQQQLNLEGQAETTHGNLEEAKFNLEKTPNLDGSVPASESNLSSPDHVQGPLQPATDQLSKQHLSQSTSTEIQGSGKSTDLVQNQLKQQHSVNQNDQGLKSVKSTILGQNGPNAAQATQGSSTQRLNQTQQAKLESSTLELQQAAQQLNASQKALLAKQSGENLSKSGQNLSKSRHFQTNFSSKGQPETTLIEQELNSNLLKLDQAVLKSAPQTLLNRPFNRNHLAGKNGMGKMGDENTKDQQQSADFNQAFGPERFSTISRSVAASQAQNVHSGGQLREFLLDAIQNGLNELQQQQQQTLELKLNHQQFGRMTISISENAGQINISLSSDTPGWENFNSQRQQLQQALEEAGYENVDLEFSQHQQQESQRQMSEGNENADNVRLAD